MIEIFTDTPVLTPLGALHFAKNLQKDFILFCQFLLGKKIGGPEGGGGHLVGGIRYICLGTNEFDNEIESDPKT